jgi:hypothetical protein
VADPRLALCYRADNCANEACAASRVPLTGFQFARVERAGRRPAYSAQEEQGSYERLFLVVVGETNGHADARGDRRLTRCGPLLRNVIDFLSGAKCSVRLRRCSLWGRRGDMASVAKDPLRAVPDEVVEAEPERLAPVAEAARAGIGAGASRSRAG